MHVSLLSLRVLFIDHYANAYVTIYLRANMHFTLILSPHPHVRTIHTQDTSSRLGAMDKVTTPRDRYVSVRSHQFFRGVNWYDIENSSELLHAVPPPTTHRMKLGLEYDCAGEMVDGSSLDFDFFS